MYPAILSESQTFAGYIGEMLQGIRNSAYGLSEEQARERPCRSALSISGLIKHATWVMRTALPGGRRSEAGSAEGAAEFLGSFTPTDGEPLDELLQEFDAVRERYLEVISAMDPAAEVTVGPKPWDGQLEPVQATQRMLLAHHIDEFARHAGHADIIREELDGAQAMPLAFAVDGREGNPYIQPWRGEVRADGDACDRYAYIQPWRGEGK